VTLVLATRNAHKLRELATLLDGYDIAALPDDVVLPPETGETFAANALPKARTAAAATGELAFGDDSGIELTRQVLDADPERRVVLYTGSSDVELLISGLDSGARGYALKEGTPHELTTALATVAEGGTYVDPRLHSALLSRRATQTQKSLSKREREIMDLLAQGLTGEQVAERLFLSPETIKTHIRNAMSKLEANTRVHAIAIALREGFISPPAQTNGRS